MADKYVQIFKVNDTDDISIKDVEARDLIKKLENKMSIIASRYVDGLMSREDKQKLDELYEENKEISFLLNQINGEEIFSND